jgi:hypothetical protein
VLAASRNHARLACSRCRGGAGETGFRVRRATPRIFCVRPGDPIWQWPASFIGVNLDHLLGLGLVDEGWAASVRRELAEREADAGSLMLTPMVLEIVAERF